MIILGVFWGVPPFKETHIYIYIHTYTHGLIYIFFVNKNAYISIYKYVCANTNHWYMHYIFCIYMPVTYMSCMMCSDFLKSPIVFQQNNEENEETSISPWFCLVLWGFMSSSKTSSQGNQRPSEGFLSSFPGDPLDHYTKVLGILLEQQRNSLVFLFFLRFYFCQRKDTTTIHNNFCGIILGFCFLFPQLTSGPLMFFFSPRCRLEPTPFSSSSGPQQMEGYKQPL